MSELHQPPQCYQCRFYAYSPYLVCADHPRGPEGDRQQHLLFFEKPRAEPPTA